jgi:hypothetical protein
VRTRLFEIQYSDGLHELGWRFSLDVSQLSFADIPPSTTISRRPAMF